MQAIDFVLGYLTDHESVIDAHQFLNFFTETRKWLEFVDLYAKLYLR